MSIECPICKQAGITAVFKNIPAYLAHVAQKHPGTEVAGGRR